MNNFCFVGGTALALKYGHRISVDLDLFSEEKYDTPAIINALEKEFAEKFEAENRNPKWGLFCYIDGIKTGIIHYPRKTINNPDVLDGVRMYSSPDIAAMKINAILGRGKKKDF